MNQHYLELYADFIVKVGVNVQPRQNFIIRCPVTMPEFGHACVKAGYEAGAKTASCVGRMTNSAACIMSMPKRKTWLL